MPLLPSTLGMALPAEKNEKEEETMNIKPVGARVLVFFKTEEKTQAGLILAKSAQEKPEFCTILAVGDGVENKDLLVGTKIMVHRYAGTDIEYDGIKASLVKESDIIAIVNDE